MPWHPVPMKFLRASVAHRSIYYRAKRRAFRRAGEITRAARANDRVKWRRVAPAVPPAGRPNVIVYCSRTTAWFIMRAGHIHVWNSGIIPLICGDHCSHRHSAKGIFSLFFFVLLSLLLYFGLLSLSRRSNDFRFSLGASRDAFKGRIKLNAVGRGWNFVRRQTRSLSAK